MKKLLLTCGIAALLTGVSSYAQAQEVEGTSTPWLHAKTTVSKTVTTTEGITISTSVLISQPVTAVVDDAAEASATANQSNQYNQDCGSCAEKYDVIENSSDMNTGLTSVNQAAGNDNNQGTLISAAVDADPIQTTGTTTTTIGTSGNPATGSGFAHAQAEATQINGFDPNAGEAAVNNEGNDVEAVDLQFRNALIDNSVNHDQGLAYVNQSTGNNNNQLNELALAFSERPQGVAIAEADLGQFNTQNTVGEGQSTLSASNPIGINKNATISTSLNNNTGIFGVNQSVGNNGNQANIVSVAAVGNNLPGF
jgi:hypothetical protein